ncbi:hypothetical protein HUJ04_012851, partial [Dendroctonus ponderosae]
MSYNSFIKVDYSFTKPGSEILTSTMAFGRNNVFRNRNSWGPVSSCGTVGLPRPDPEEEYTERMATAQMRQLDPLKEDLADWLNKTLGKCFCFLY